MQSQKLCSFGKAIYNLHKLNLVLIANSFVFSEILAKNYFCLGLLNFPVTESVARTYKVLNLSDMLNCMKNILIVKIQRSYTFTFFQKSFSEAAAVLICYPGICPVGSYGSLLPDGCFLDPICHVKGYLPGILALECNSAFYGTPKMLVSWKLMLFPKSFH